MAKIYRRDNLISGVQIKKKNEKNRKRVILQILPIKKALLTSNYFYTLCFF